MQAASAITPWPFTHQAWLGVMVNARSSTLNSRAVARHFIVVFPRVDQIVLTGKIGTITTFNTLFYLPDNCQRLNYGYRMKLIASGWSQFEKVR